MKHSRLKSSYKMKIANGRCLVDVVLKNTSRLIAFFNQLQFLNAEMQPVRPSFYTDNFFSLMPGEVKTVTIETAERNLAGGLILRIKGWNVETVTRKLK
ncbi:MAG: hypothetical protein H9928_02145 [Candidatus Phocaeicola excrementipullorum]|uniref:Exo-beta-D-glucosaminidase Ig-fold domain-containing protein n=1 Tax=Candidatus Phocaeicola excrementipullorum TaxID=2838731 RepID=A0A948TL39_9BACT|nr:hypothetical protein [Candidatus Phocaeicola excrementipullorum]